MIKNWKPTSGNCYQDCYYLATEDPRFAGAVLCHGYPRLTRANGDRPAGTVYGHAWLEMPVVLDITYPGGEKIPQQVMMVFDHQHTADPVPVCIFYMVGKINEVGVRRYTAREAMVAAVKAQHYGPWHVITKKKKKNNQRKSLALTIRCGNMPV